MTEFHKLIELGMQEAVDLMEDLLSKDLEVTRDEDKGVWVVRVKDWQDKGVLLETRALSTVALYLKSLSKGVEGGTLLLCDYENSAYITFTEGDVENVSFGLNTDIEHLQKEYRIENTLTHLYTGENVQLLLGDSMEKTTYIKRFDKYGLLDLQIRVIDNTVDLQKPLDYNTLRSVGESLKESSKPLKRPYIKREGEPNETTWVLDRRFDYSNKPSEGTTPKPVWCVLVDKHHGVVLAYYNGELKHAYSQTGEHDNLETVYGIESNRGSRETLLEDLHDLKGVYKDYL